MLLHGKQYARGVQKGNTNLDDRGFHNENKESSVKLETKVKQAEVRTGVREGISRGKDGLG